MTETTVTKATDMTPLMMTATIKDTVEIVETVDETIVEAEEEAVVMTDMILMPQSKRRSITSRKGQSGTRANILNTRMNNTGTHLS
jgi:hypothetical protein